MRHHSIERAKPMIRPSRRSVLAALGAGLLASAAPVRGETSKPPAEGGLGGTGIVGTLMGFGSLIVNGFRVDTDPETTFSSTIGLFDPGSLAIGQTLTIEAVASAEGLLAKRVHVTYPLVGRAEVMPGRPGRLRVAGVDVEAEPDGMTAVSPGQRVLVSGVWRGNRVIAGRIDPAPGISVSAIAGAVSVEHGTGRLVLGGRPLRLAQGLKAPADGSFVTVIGRALADRFVADQIVEGRFTGAAGSLVQLSVDGYLDPTETAPGFTIAGLGHSFDAEAKLSAFRNDRALFTGPYVGVFAVQTGIILPEQFQARQAIIEELLERPASVEAISTR
jgi:hypothetical protein